MVFKITVEFGVWGCVRAEEMGSIKLVPRSRVKAPQAPRYTNFRKPREAKLDEVF